MESSLEYNNGKERKYTPTAEVLRWDRFTNFMSADVSDSQARNSNCKSAKGGRTAKSEEFKEKVFKRYFNAATSDLERVWWR